MLGKKIEFSSVSQWGNLSLKMSIKIVALTVPWVQKSGKCLTNLSTK